MTNDCWSRRDATNEVGVIFTGKWNEEIKGSASLKNVSVSHASSMYYVAVDFQSADCGSEIGKYCRDWGASTSDATFVYSSYRVGAAPEEGSLCLFVLW